MPEIESELRERVRIRASGLCEYCLIPERFTLAEHEIDHVIAIKHGGLTTEDNLALCCTICNRFKGSDIASLDPETGRLTSLFHPRADVWIDHFEVRNAEIIGISPKGRVTVRILRTNSPARIKERQLLRV